MCIEDYFYFFWKYKVYQISKLIVNHLFIYSIYFQSYFGWAILIKIDYICCLSGVYTLHQDRGQACIQLSFPLDSWIFCTSVNHLSPQEYHSFPLKEVKMPHYSIDTVSIFLQVEVLFHSMQKYNHVIDKNKSA